MHQIPNRHEEYPDWLRPRGSMLSECPVPGCTTITMGGTCVAHDPPVTTSFTRGRPFVSAEAEAELAAAPG